MQRVDDIRKAIDGIWCGFVWDKSPQGYDFWSNVVQELEKLAKMAEESE